MLEEVRPASPQNSGGIRHARISLVWPAAYPHADADGRFTAPACDRSGVGTRPIGIPSSGGRQASDRRLGEPGVLGRRIDNERIHVYRHLRRAGLSNYRHIKINLKQRALKIELILSVELSEAVQDCVETVKSLQRFVSFTITNTWWLSFNSLGLFPKLIRPLAGE